MKKMMNDHCIHKRIQLMTEMRGASSEKHQPRKKTSLPMVGEGASVSNVTGSKTAS